MAKGFENVIYVLGLIHWKLQKFLHKSSSSSSIETRISSKPFRLLLTNVPNLHKILI